VLYIQISQEEQNSESFACVNALYHVSSVTFLRDHGVFLVLHLMGSCLAYNRYDRGLERFNGATLASISSFWRVAEVWR
jgi:glucan phosphoethanolaminetransferase (alkaline phosphatase superfamily)